eukprot:5776770-Lingulodinium_polyedra.AAC.1
MAQTRPKRCAGGSSSWPPSDAGAVRAFPTMPRAPLEQPVHLMSCTLLTPNVLTGLRIHEAEGREPHAT